MINRKRSQAETELLKGLGLNSEQAINWMNPELLNYRSAPVANSLLSSGDWYKIEIRENNIGDGKSDAMYKMTKTFLERSGMNLTNVDPRTMKMYGNGGNLLPEDINAARPQDLIEIPIYIEGENDGDFDPQDFVVFYGRSINNWIYSQTNQNYSHYVNPYSLSNCYWICLNTPGNGDRMILQPSENVSNPITPSSFIEKLFYEPEINNLINEGNVWLSERKSNGQSITWNNTLTGLEANSNILYAIKPASRMFCGYSNHMEIKEEHSTMSSYFYTMGCVSPGYGDWIWTAPTSFTINASQKTDGELSTFKATYFSNSPDAEGYLDWMEIQYII
jgi:hypothetical protein